MQQVPKETFGVTDLVLFFGFFSLSLAIGGYFAFRDRKKQSTENYYFGGRNVSPLPAGISIALSFISAITVIGSPSEVYLYGNVFLWYCIAMVIVNIVGIVYYVPLYHKLQLSSVYEYLELRFHRSARLMVSGLITLSTIAYLGLATYVPALALNTVTPLSLSWTIALTSLTCTIYTALGGLKAVIWTDVFRSIVMVSGMIGLLVRTSSLAGGVYSIFEATERGERNNFFKFDPDPRIRSTSWAIGLGSVVSFSYENICSQSSAQRWLSCKTISTARVAVVVSTVVAGLLNILSHMNGVAAYGYYEGCDPLKSGLISKSDQLIPLMVIDVFQAIPGMAGLFFSAAFCGTLSTVSSGINALAAMTMTDFVPICSSNLSEKKIVLLSKMLTSFFGLLTLIVAYLISTSSSNAMGIIMFTLGWFTGPVVSLFTMGAFMPWINCKTALCGCISSLAVVSWIAIGSLTVPTVPEGWKPLPLSTENCGVLNEGASINVTSVNYLARFTTSEIKHEEKTVGVEESLYSISFYLYGAISLLLSISIAHIASIFTGFRKPVGKECEFSVPIVATKYLPTAVRKYFKDETRNYEYNSALQKSSIDDEKKINEAAL